MSDRPTYLITLRPEPGVGNPTMALKVALKRLLRDHRLRCMTVAETSPPDAHGARRARGGRLDHARKEGE